MAPSCSESFDVVVIGAGIIGLTIARHILLHSDLSVAVVDASVPCSGATGAGQGYIWMAHKTPGSETYELVKRSHQLWHQLAESIVHEGSDPLAELGWQKTGSLLVGRNSEDSTALKKRVKQLSAAGLQAEYLSSNELQCKEPELGLGFNGCAAFLPDDAQLDTKRTIAYIQKENQAFASQCRYAEYFCDPALRLTRSHVTGNIEGVKTKKRMLYSRKAVVVAAGCWTGSLMKELIQDSDVEVNLPVQPRKGVLLVVENEFLKLNHALMEVGYIDHLASPSQSVDHGLSISMGVTIDANGNLLLGSSREFAGFDTEIDMGVANRIWERAGEFFPALKKASLDDLSEKWKARVGLRRYMPDGKPVIGPVPQMPNLYVATGHEGGGIAMALGTAEMVVDMVLNNPTKVDANAFCCSRQMLLIRIQSTKIVNL